MRDGIGEGDGEGGELKADYAIYQKDKQLH